MPNLTELMQRISFKPLNELTDDESLAMMRIRNEPQIRRNMYFDGEIDEERHRRWLEQVLSDDSVRRYAVVMDGAIIGGVGLTHISWEHKRADWTFYLSDSTQGRGVGSVVEFLFLTKVFEEFPIEKLNCEVLDFNSAVIALHKKFGFVEEGVRRQHIERDERRPDVTLLGITRAEWQEKQAELRARLFH